MPLTTQIPGSVQSKAKSVHDMHALNFEDCAEFYFPTLIKQIARRCDYPMLRMFYVSLVVCFTKKEFARMAPFLEYACGDLW